MKRPYLGTEPADFLLMACDGYQSRLEGMQEQLSALRQTIEAIASGRSAPTRKTEPKTPTDARQWTPERHKATKARWTPARRKAARAEMNRRIAAGFIPGKGWPKGKGKRPAANTPSAGRKKATTSNTPSAGRKKATTSNTPTG